MPSQREKEGGTIASNRLDFQIDQALVFALELFDNSNYLIVIDYEDDLTIYNDESCREVRFYQVKTNEDEIALSEAITQGWIDKLYAHISDKETSVTPNAEVKEVSLLTNCSLRYGKNKHLSYDLTPFGDIKDSTIISRIRETIAKKCNTSPENIDLSLFTHRKSRLTLKDHKKYSCAALSTFLQKRFSCINVSVVESTHLKLRDLLTERQNYEKNATEIDFEYLRKHKTFTKDNLICIIRDAILVLPPNMSDIERYIPVDFNNDWKAACYEVVKDFQDNNKSFNHLAKQVYILSLKSRKETASLWEETQIISSEITNNSSLAKQIPCSSKHYLEVLILAILHNKNIIKDEPSLI